MIQNCNMNLDWEVPWLARYRAIGEPIARQVAQGSPVHAALNEALDANPQIQCSIRFAPQEDSQGAAAYESFIWQTKTVPTRDNLHDFFNGLVWLHFPKIKAKLNKLQAAAIAEAGVTPTRGQLRDALTLFDENAAFLIESNPNAPLLEAIRNKAWQDAFIARRMDWARTEVAIFGHALLEKLVAPRKAITAHVFCPPTLLSVGTDINRDSDIDTQLASQLNAPLLATKPYAPLPVMGIPNWCADNTEKSFYDDVQVFRLASNLKSA